MQNGWTYYRDIDGSEVKHAPKTLVGNVYVQEAETVGLQSLLDSKLQNKAAVIETTHIADGAVAGTKLANAAVTSGKIANDAIRDEHIPVAQISPDKIADLANTVLVTVQEKLAQVTSGAMLENELYRQVVMAITTAIEKAGIDGTVEDDLCNQIVAIVDKALQASIETTKLIANSIDVKDNIVSSRIDAGHLFSNKIVVSNAKVVELQADAIDAISSEFEIANITDLTVADAHAANLTVNAAVAGILKTGELELSNGGKPFRLKVTDDGQVEAVEGGISGDAIADASLAGEKIVEGSITAAKINVNDLFASTAFISTLKTYLIETEKLGVLIKQADDLSMYFDFTDNGLVIKKQNSKFSMQLDDDELTFFNDSSVVTRIQDGKMNIKDATIDNTLSLGDHKWSIEDGSLSLVWKGDV